MSGFTCRDRDREVWFRVADGLIEMRSARHRHSAIWRPLLAGTVSPDGGFALRATTSSRFATGQILGDRLTASDVPNAIAVQEGRTVCTYRYEAVREDNQPR